MRKALMLLACMTSTTLSHGAIAWVQDASAGATPAVTLKVAFGSNVTAGALIVVTARVGATGRTVTSTDTLANVYSLDASKIQITDVHVNDIFSTYNSAGGANTVTINMSGAGARMGMTIREYSGAATAVSPVDVSSNAIGADASVECGTLTMTKDGVIVTGWGYQNNQTTTLDTDYANLEQETTGRLGSAQRITTAITDEAIHTASASNNWSCVSVAYSEPAAGGAVAPVLRRPAFLMRR